MPTEDSFHRGIESLEQDLQLPSKFLARLTDEGDWSFVIKAHALVEAALSHLLAAAVRDRRVTRIFQRLETSNETIGKLAFIKAMGLLPDRQLKFVKHLAELRNQLVHDVSNTGFTFNTFVGGLDKGQRKKFREAFTWRVKPRSDAPLDDWQEQAFDSPKYAIWINVVLLLAEAYRKKLDFIDEDSE